jgi:hypothetical protein
MQVATNWDKCATAAHLWDALRLLTDDANDDADDNPADDDATPPAVSHGSRKGVRNLFRP